MLGLINLDTTKTWFKKNFFLNSASVFSNSGLIVQMIRSYVQSLCDRNRSCFFKIEYFSSHHQNDP